jgi:hypothetical protein
LDFFSKKKLYLYIILRIPDQPICDTSRLPVEKLCVLLKSDLQTFVLRRVIVTMACTCEDAAQAQGMTSPPKRP